MALRTSTQIMSDVCRMSLASKSIKQRQISILCRQNLNTTQSSQTSAFAVYSNKRSISTKSDTQPLHQNARKQAQQQRQQHEVEIPTFSFKDLGATKPVKIVLYTSLTILATLETYFYTRWIYHYLYPNSTPEVTHYLKRVYRYFCPIQQEDPAPNLASSNAVTEVSEAGDCHTPHSKPEVN